MDTFLQQAISTSDYLDKQTNRYIDDLIDQASGDRDFIISQIKRQHELALGNNDQQTAQFLEGVADKLEEKIGRIPYDYQVGVTRTNEDIQTATQRAKQNRSNVLSRLAEDEQVWKEQFEKESTDARANQQEELLKRGILTGTREDATGLAGRETRRLDSELGEILGSYQRALGRSREDINKQTEDQLFDINRAGTRTLEDLKTGARRGAIDQQDSTKYGTESAKRQFEATKKELDKQRQRLLEMSGSRALLQTSQQYQ